MRWVVPAFLLSIAPAWAVVSCTRGSPDGGPPDGGPPDGGPPDGGPRAAADTSAPCLDVDAGCDAGPGTFCCYGIPVTFGATVPTNFGNVTNQCQADCFAWAEFVALSWPSSEAQPDAGFGDPGDLSPVTWETYASSTQVFQPDAAPPPPWGTPPTPPTPCAQAAKDLRARGFTRPRLMVQTSEFGTELLDPQNTAPNGLFSNSPSWVGAQNRTNLWYDARLNQIEYDYIVRGELYNAATQLQTIERGRGIFLPDDAIELKAAWMEVTTPTDPRWSTYKLTWGFVIDPGAGTCRTVELALVALHLIQKVNLEPYWVWATFEHENLAPDQGALDAGVPDGGYDLYNPACEATTVCAASSCIPDGGATAGPCDGGALVTVGCAPNTRPPYLLGPACPGPTPVQVTRVMPRDDYATSVNGIVKGQIASRYPSSVWQYYQLVNVGWAPPCKYCGIPPTPQKIPTLPPGAMLPKAPGPDAGSLPLANVAIETYMQTTTCVYCHSNAPIAIATKPQWATNFSFLFRTAQTQGSAPKPNGAAPKKPKR